MTKLISEALSFVRPICSAPTSFFSYLCFLGPLMRLTVEFPNYILRSWTSLSYYQNVFIVVLIFAPSCKTADGFITVLTVLVACDIIYIFTYWPW